MGGPEKHGRGKESGSAGPANRAPSDFHDVLGARYHSPRSGRPHRVRTCGRSRTLFL